MRLLLVEDDLHIQQFLKRALVEAGYQVDAALDAKAAEALALEGVHDAFIIDLGLPDMDGLDLIARCRAQDPMAFRAFVVRYERAVFALRSQINRRPSSVRFSSTYRM